LSVDGINGLTSETPELLTSDKLDAFGSLSNFMYKKGAPTTLVGAEGRCFLQFPFNLLKIIFADGA
jgi:hypothetical protein